MLIHLALDDAAVQERPCDNLALPLETLRSLVSPTFTVLKRVPQPSRPVFDHSQSPRDSSTAMIEWVVVYKSESDFIALVFCFTTPESPPHHFEVMIVHTSMVNWVIRGPDKSQISSSAVSKHQRCISAGIRHGTTPADLCGFMLVGSSFFGS